MPKNKKRAMKFDDYKNEKFPKSAAKENTTKFEKNPVKPQLQKTATKNLKVEKRPDNSTRYDNIGHLPEIDRNSNPVRCKNEGCQLKSYIYCSKCQVHLCLIQGRNCYKSFHTLTNDCEK